MRFATRTLVPVLLLLAGCGAPTATLPPAHCLALGVDVRGLEWSQRGTFLAVGAVRADGIVEARVVNADGTPAGAVATDPGLDAPFVTLSAAGGLAWLEGAGSDPVLVEDRPEGRLRVGLPEGSVQLHWTAIGYAVLQQLGNGPNRILIVDPDRPLEPTVLLEVEFGVAQFWISADPEMLLLTSIRASDQIGFEVIGATTSRFVEPPGVDLSGASMPGLRRHIVYRSEANGRMIAVLVDDAQSQVALTSGPTRLGRVSDAGILAYVPVDPPGTLCLVDVSGVLP